MFGKIGESQWLIYAVLIIFFLWLSYLSLRLWQILKSRRQLSLALKKDKDIQLVISDVLKEIEELDARQEKAEDSIKNNRFLLGKTGRYTSLVRYDAFADIGGKLSFSTAILNESGDGIIITSIIGRNDNRVYAKPIKGRVSSYPLSEEEKRAIAAVFEERSTKNR